MNMSSLYLVGGFLLLASVYLYIFPTKPYTEMSDEDFQRRLKEGHHD